jgi:hypothetical protein
MKLVARAARRLTAPLRLLPDFIIIGAQKCGTTSLYEYLEVDPAVGSASKKEVHFFDLRYARGVGYYRTHFPSSLYRRYTERKRGEPFITGEASPYYLYHPAVPERVRRLLPQAKLIAMLRNPADRALSHYHHEARAGREALTFEEALDREAERLGSGGAEEPGTAHRRHSYLSRGLYAEQLERWFALFPREQFLILQSERFYADPAAAMEEVQAFLGLPARHTAEYTRRNSGRYDRMDPALRWRLSDYYRHHNQRLYGLLGVDYGWE